MELENAVTSNPIGEFVFRIPSFYEVLFMMMIRRLLVLSLAVVAGAAFPAIAVAQRGASRGPANTAHRLAPNLMRPATPTKAVDVVFLFSKFGG